MANPFKYIYYYLQVSNTCMNEDLADDTLEAVKSLSFCSYWVNVGPYFSYPLDYEDRDP